jgi:hypothetical protein
VEELKKVKLGDLEIKTTCPWYSVQIAPTDFKPGDELEFICEDKEDTDCLECLMAAAVTTLMHIRDIQYTALKEARISSGPGGIPLIKTRK